MSCDLCPPRTDGPLLTFQARCACSCGTVLPIKASSASAHAFPIGVLTRTTVLASVPACATIPLKGEWSTDRSMSHSHVFVEQTKIATYRNWIAGSDSFRPNNGCLYKWNKACQTKSFKPMLQLLQVLQAWCEDKPLLRSQLPTSTSNSDCDELVVKSIAFDITILMGRANRKKGHIQR